MEFYKTSLFIFRRDLRLHDNNALNEALRRSEKVIPCFIFDPRQIEQHAYQSKPALSFMLEAIDDLQHELQGMGDKLALFHARPESVIIKLYQEQQIQAVFINRDYTPFSRRRDHDITDICKKLEIKLYYLADALLTEPEQAAKNDQTPYKVFTAFYNHARQFPVIPPHSLVNRNFLSLPNEFSVDTILSSLKSAATMKVCGGRQQALSLISQLDSCSDYQNIRDFPALNATSKLSAHLKFGTCSVREVFYAVTEQLGDEHPLLRQLYWRDFFTHIAYHFPHVFQRAFIEKFAHLQWDNNRDYFEAWCAGKTGFPIVDAGMRELNATGFMHNRLRMIVASFLVKDLHIDWRWGERYFARHLVDYDPCINNGNWQWAASTGCDAQPYFRIFNPWLQQQKFDADCQYIYQWLPELSQISTKIIHQWNKQQTNCDYPAPIIDHAYESRVSKIRFKECIT